MSCPCRVAPMRSFIRGLAQVHKLDTSFSSSVRFAPDSRAVTSRRIIAARSTRAFHESRQLRQDVAAEAPTPPTEPRQESPVAPDSSKEPHHQLDGAKDDSGSKQVKKPKTKSKPAKAKTTKPKTTKAKKTANQSNEDLEGPEESFRNSSKKRKPRTKPDEATERPPRKAHPPKGLRSDKPKDNKMRDIANSIVARRGTDRPDENDETPKRERPRWLVEKEALSEKFPQGWSPPKRLSPDALAGIRALNAQFPDVYNVPALSSHFKVSPENIRRILRSKWRPNQEEEEDRERRWHLRGKSIWEAKAALGIKPPRKWREQGITRDAAYHQKRQQTIERRKENEEQEKAAYKDWRQRFNHNKGIV